MPEGILRPETALGVAVGELMEGRHGCVTPPCDARFGRDVLAVIDAAARQVAGKGPWSAT